MLYTTLQLGVRNLLLHKLRSFLTMLGTILGVGSVISMLAIGEGSKRKALEEIRQLGATNVIVRSVKPQQENSDDGSSSGGSQQNVSRVLEYGLTYKDYELLNDTLPTVKRSLPIALVRKDVSYKHRRMVNARVLGTTPSCLDVKHLSVRRGGRFLSATDRGTNVTVLGAGAAKKLFSFEDPIGQSVLVGDDVYRVIGVLTARDSGNAVPGGAQQADFNNDIYVPLKAIRTRIGDLQMIVRAGSREFEKTELSEITLTVTNEDFVAQTAAMVRKLLKQNHPNGNDYQVIVPLELLQKAQRQKRIWNLVLGSIAGISLLVGGIGIMNIMLATVTERTREIGVRRALGATRRHITAQFLVETTVLSSVGGLLGVVLGVVLPVVVSTLVPDIETAMNWWFLIMAFGISVATGIVFGMYPARRAAMMDPIEALRHE